jgi:homoserine dehydrogenase
MQLRLFCLGFGNVGQALASLLATKADVLYRRYGLLVRYTGIYTRSTGFVGMSEGASPAQVVAMGWPPRTAPDSNRRQSPRDEVVFSIRECPADVVIELTPLDPYSGQPALDHIRTALAAGRSVVTANKGPIAYAYRELRALAAAKGVALRFESTVMDGTPLFGMVESCLPATEVLGCRGALNSTSNYVLSRMAAGEALEQALGGAQRLGIAEADPSYDLDGWDASVKAAVLANVLMDADLRPEDVRREGLGAEAMRQAHAALVPGQTLKQVVEATRENGVIVVRVRLAALPPAAVFAQLSGMETGLLLRTDTMGDLTFVEGEGGPEQTALGVLADLVAIARTSAKQPLP